MKKLFGKVELGPRLDHETADQILQNVFESAGYDPNTVPLEVLSSYSNYRKERYSLQRTILITVLVLFMLLPLLFIASKITIAMRDVQSGENPVYDVSVSTGIPVSQITATIDGKRVSIYELDSHQYVIRPETNGEMKIDVTLINNQRTSVEVNVGTADSVPPTLVSTAIENGSFRLYVSDEDSGVDDSNISVKDDDGNTYTYMYNSDKGCLTVDYPSVALDVDIPDIKGNILRLRLMPQGTSEE